MPDTSTNTNLISQVYAKELDYEIGKMEFFKKFLGPGNIIQKHVDFTKVKGSTYNYGLAMMMSNDGVTGDNTMAGNEEALTTYNDSVVIDQLRNAVVLTGRLDEQKAAYNLRELAKRQLSEWFPDRMERICVNHLCGVTTETFPAAGIAPNAANWLIGNDTTLTAESSLTSSMPFTASHISKAKIMAMMASPKIKPVKTDGGEYYVMFIHPYQVHYLKSDPDWQAKNWFAHDRGLTNPIFTGALGIYDGVVCHEHDRLYWSSTIDSGTLDGARAVLCGQSALIYAEGAGPSWDEETRDFGNKYAACVGKIFGIKKVRYNSKDYATITVSTYAPAV